MSLRVALVCPYSLDQPGGVGTHVLGLAGWLAGQGHQVDVVAPGTRPLDRAIDGVAVHQVGRSLALRGNGSIAQLAVLPGQSVEARRLVADADVVHVHEPLTPGIAFAVARRAERLVVTHHACFDPSGPVRAVLRRRAAALGERTTLAVSDAAAWTARRVTGAEPLVIPNAITPPPAPLPRSGWRGGLLPQIGFLGRRDESRKGFATFAALAGHAAAAGVNADFVAAGPGRARAPHVRDVGLLTDAERAAWLGGVDVLVAPNLRGESFGVVLVEALAAGCDVLASDLPGFAAVLAEAGCGRVFRTGDVEDALVQLLATLADPVDPIRAHAAAGRWSWEAVGPRILRVLEQRAGRVPDTGPGGPMA